MVTASAVGEGEEEKEEENEEEEKLIGRRWEILKLVGRMNWEERQDMN